MIEKDLNLEVERTLKFHESLLFRMKPYQISLLIAKHRKSKYRTLKVLCINIWSKNQYRIFNHKLAQFEWRKDSVRKLVRSSKTERCLTCALEIFLVLFLVHAALEKLIFLVENLLGTINSTFLRKFAIIDMCKRTK